MECFENDCCCNPGSAARPRKLSFNPSDYIRVLISWMFAFRRTFLAEPGLYYTGEAYNINSPLLVTCNYHMTVFLLWRILHNRDIRLLVIDTEGINVWCSSGKGRFCAKEILKQINSYQRDIITTSDRVELVLPKLSLSGVSLVELKNNNIEPKIGPVYANELPAYLEDLPLKNCNNERYVFSLKERLFTLVPSLVQIIRYGIYITAALFVWHFFTGTGIYWQIIPIMASIVILFVVFFPVLPTRRFTVKGMALYSLLAAAFICYYFSSGYAGDILSFIFYLSFLGGTCLFFSLSYTGNSGVSNYSLVKKEIVRYLPVTAVCFLVSIITIIIKGLA